MDVHLAPTWDNADRWVATLRHAAREGRVFVVGTYSCIRGADVPSEPSRPRRPLGIRSVEIDAPVAHRTRREFDPVGHYARNIALEFFAPPSA